MLTVQTRLKTCVLSAMFGAGSVFGQPLAVNVNLNGHALLPTHIGKGWTERQTIDARCGPNESPDAVACYYAILEANNAGRYISGSRVQKTTLDFPPESVLESAMPGGSLVVYGTRNYADIRKLTVRAAFAEAIKAELTARPGPTVLVDNIVHPSADPNWPFPWELTCDVLARIRGTERQIIANVAGASWGWTDADCGVLAAGVDGMAFEMPFHRLARESAANTRRQIEVYRRWLAAGKTIVLIPVDTSLTNEPDKEAEARYVAAFAMIVRGPGQSMFVSAPYFKATPDWAAWPETFGAKRDDYHQEGLTLVQAFENGVLRITPPRTVYWSPRT